MYNQLTSEQRYEIYLGIKRKWSISRISREIEVSASTVLREIRRNSNTNGEYVWRTAQRKAEARKHGLEGNHRKPAELWVSRNLVGINFRHPNVMPNFAVWKTITYRHWHRWCCQPRF